MQITQSKNKEAWVNILTKGIITIPKKMREQVGIKEGDVAKVRVENNKIIIEPREENEYRTFTDKQIRKWLKEDELSPQLVKKLDELWPELP